MIIILWPGGKVLENLDMFYRRQRGDFLCNERIPSALPLQANAIVFSTSHRNKPDNPRCRTVFPTTRTSMKGDFYLDVETKFRPEETSESGAHEAKEIIKKSLKELFGECGTLQRVDILKHDPVKGRLFLRCPSDYYIKLRSCLILCSTTGSAFEIKKASPSLLSLLSDSGNGEF